MALLVVAFLFTRGCANRSIDIEQDEAIAIAKRQVDFTPNNVGIRLLRRGVKSTPFWNVSLSVKLADGSFRNVTVVIIDARTGRVDEIQRS